MRKQLLTIILILWSATVLHAQTGFISTIAGEAGINSFNGDGPALYTYLNFPAGMFIDKAGNIFFCDQQNYRVRELNTAGKITTVAGKGTFGFSGDGGQATDAELYSPGGVCVDAAGNIYIADVTNNAIRKVNTAGIISTIAGIGGVDSNGYNGDGIAATAAKLAFPYDVVTDAAGNLYIADAGNNRIRKVNTAGIISTIAGNSVRGYSTDGGMATNAALVFPFSLVLDAAGNVYITDSSRIRKINTAGIISTIAGDGTIGSSGDGGPATAAQLYFPVALSMDAAGTIYVADQNTNSVRKIDTSGIINLVAGTGTFGFTGDGGPATAATFRYPSGIAVDPSGNIYVSDNENFVLREITPFNPALSAKQAALNNRCITVFPNPASTGITVGIPQGAVGGTLTLYNASGQLVKSSVLYSASTAIPVSDLAEGAYFLTYTTPSCQWNSQFTKLH